MRTLHILLAFLLLPTISMSQLSKKQITVQRDNATRNVGFYQFLPPGYSTGHPLIIYLHGIGERGDDGNGGTSTATIGSLTNTEIPRLLTGSATMRFTSPNGYTGSFVVLAPQLWSGFGWWPNWYVEEMIAYAKTNLKIDPNRIYLTGLSLGGGGVWDATESATIAKSLAAIAPVCGTCTYDANTSQIIPLGIPVYAFHGSGDPVVWVGCTDNAIADISARKGIYLYQRYNANYHNIWTQAYDTTHAVQNPNVFEWFLQYSLGPLPPPPLPLVIYKFSADWYSPTEVVVDVQADGEKYIVEKSLDGVNFTTAATVSSTQKRIVFSL